VNAQRSAIFLHDEERKELWTPLASGTSAVIRIPESQGIAGHVLQTGEEVNIHDAYSDPRFNPESDKKLNFRTYHILAVPVRSPSSNKIIGVTQVRDLAHATRGKATPRAPRTTRC